MLSSITILYHEWYTDAHERAGLFLAGKIANFIGVGEYEMNHVQGGTTLGYELLDESRTMIVALMRGEKIVQRQEE